MTAETSTLEKFEIRNRFSNAVQVTAEISVTPDMSWSVKLGMAIKWAIKSRANLSGAYLSGANLSRAYLSGADLSGAYLSGANLSGADLSGANLSGANLSGADLSGADLSGAYLSGADLSGAYLSGAYLSRAKDADLAIARTRILPEGALIGWKKCRDSVIVKLRIPEDAPRSHAYGRKCRAQFAEVLEIFGADEARSQHDRDFVYRTGERVEAPNWSADWEEECSGGVHFFITRAEAEAY
ncbi:pentapeptide repeat-containing protein [Sphingopyxis sp. C-1]|uniref:pentapeptide repeat-containing protein n=1 Tax=Sphingopyxis sp. C-1 TaxID=262667 RepID=UPI0006C62BB9|nr:pentapeptide repeat-containing protein [Sphingopyxis sp. C-1]GAO78677.1 pentapeptide repeat family protein [Sphingopyxis sp. C-1]